MYLLNVRHEFTTDDVSANWRDVDCSAYVPAGATGGLFEVYNAVTNAVQVRMRKNGSADEPYGGRVFLGQRVTKFIEFDSGKVVEASVYQGNVGDTKFALVGYMDDKVHWLSPSQVGASLAAGSWQDCDVSAYAPEGTAGIIVRCVNEDGVARYVGVRKNGSSVAVTNWKQPLGNATHQVVGVDDNRIFELYKHSGYQTSMKFYILGYLLASDGWVVDADYTDVSPATTGSFQDVDLTAQCSGAESVLIHVVNNGSSGKKGAVRLDGSADDNTANQAVAATFTQTSPAQLSAGDIFEAYIQDADVDIKFFGYLRSGLAASQGGYTSGYAALAGSGRGAHANSVDGLVGPVPAYAGACGPSQASTGSYAEGEFFILEEEVGGYTGGDELHSAQTWQQAHCIGPTPVPQSGTVPALVWGFAPVIPGEREDFYGEPSPIGIPDIGLSEFQGGGGQPAFPGMWAQSAFAQGAATPGQTNITGDVRGCVPGYEAMPTHFLLDMRRTFTCAGIGWATFDCSPYVPAGVTGLIFEVYTVGASAQTAVMRKNGTSGEPYASQLPIRQRTDWMLGCDASIRVQAKQGDAATPANTKFDLIGYTFATGIIWVTPVYVGSGTAGAWVDRDLSADVGPAAVGAVLSIGNEDSAARFAAVRKKGSTDDYQNFALPAGKRDFCIVGLDSVKRFQQWIELSNTSITLYGYVESTPGWSMLDNLVDCTPTGLFWQDAQVPQAGAVAAILYIFNDDTGGHSAAVRKKGSLDDNVTYQRLAAKHGQCFIMDLTAGGYFQVYRPLENISVKVLGYLSSSEAVTSRDGFLYGVEPLPGSMSGAWSQGCETVGESAGAHVSGYATPSTVKTDAFAEAAEAAEAAVGAHGVTEHSESAGAVDAYVESLLTSQAQADSHVSGTELVLENLGADAPAMGQDAHARDCYIFAGGAQAVVQPASCHAGNPQITAEIWAMSAGGEANDLVTLQNGPDLIRIESADGGGLRARFTTGEAADQLVSGPPGSIRDGGWHHLAVVYDGTKRNTGSASFNGANGFVSSGTVFPSARSYFTVEAHIRARFNQRIGEPWRTPVISNWNIWREGQQGYALWAFCDGAGKTRWEFVVCDGTGYATAAFGELPDGEFAATYGGRWVYVAGTFGSGTLKLYVDGSLGTTLTGAGATMVPDMTAMERLGHHVWSAAYLNGELDDVRVWSVERMADEIAADHLREIALDSPGLEAYWKLNEGTGLNALDSTGHGHEGGLSDGAGWSTSVPFLTGTGAGTGEGVATVYRDGVPGVQTIVAGWVLSCAPNVVIHGMGDSSVDDLRFWRVARTGAEINSCMGYELSGAEPGLVAYFRLNDGRGLSASDTAGGTGAALVDGPAWTTDIPPILRGSRDTEAH